MKTKTKPEETTPEGVQAQEQAVEEPKSAAVLRLELAAAHDALPIAAAAIAEKRDAYQAALDAEATGRADEGTALRALQALRDAEHGEDLAKAKVRVLERELREAAEREAHNRAQEIAGEIARVNAAADDLSNRLLTTANALLALLAEADGVNAGGMKLTAELDELNASGIGRGVRRYSPRHAAFSLPFRRRLEALLARRGAPSETARFMV